MARPGRRSGESREVVPQRAEALNAPFRELRRRLAAGHRAGPASAVTAPDAVAARSARVAARGAPPPGSALRPSASPAAEPAHDDGALFASAMQGVARLEREPHGRVDGPPPAANAAPPLTDDAEALAALSDLVAGVARFDVTDTREYVEGAVVGLDPRLLRKLRRGEFAWQAHVDLHGLTAEPARDAVERFLLESYRAGRRCVLVVHGRGRNSKDQIPVLKERLKSWLARGRIGRVVLAFTTARACDGGAGALYVLLRRDRTPRPIQVTEGAPR